MLDFASIEKYKENNRIEAKKSLGGFPKSLWETYSAFANTLGGVILLGVEEYKDKSFHTVDLPDPYSMVNELFEGLNDPQKVSVNILSASDVSVIKVNGHRIIAIEVPRASRFYKPVYINGDVQKGTYRRNGEGDYKCTAEEIAQMVRDASVVTADMKPLQSADFTIDSGSLFRFRRLFGELCDGHPYLNLNGENFLLSIGAAVKQNGCLYPTVAGALMFGVGDSIKKYFSKFFLSLKIEDENGNVTSSMGRGGNVFDFWCNTVSEIKKLGVKFGLDGSAVTAAVMEAFVNGITNADYFSGGVSLSICPEGVKITNSGGIRINRERIGLEAVSDRRNEGLARMLGLVDAAKGLGTGIIGIFETWHRIGWSKPVIRETFDPEKTTVQLFFGKNDGSRALFEDDPFFRRLIYKEEIINFLTKNISGDFFDIVRHTEGDEEEIYKVLSEMIGEGIITESFEGRNRQYRMKA